MSKQQVSIYGLCDPRTSELRFIGATAQPLRQKLAKHLQDEPNASLAYWITSLRNQHLVPEIFELESVEPSDWREAHEYWIAYFRSVEADLLPFSDGRQNSAA